MWLNFGFALFSTNLAHSMQQPLSTSIQSSHMIDVEVNEHYQFHWPIRKAAIIGAGPSGLVAFRELKEAGLEARIFERDNAPGGIWHYSEEIPLNTPVPNAMAAIGDFEPSLPPTDVELPYSEEFEDNGQTLRDLRGLKPVWESLTSNAPSPLQQFLQWPWPVGTPWELNHYQYRNYVRSYASYLNSNSNDENPRAAYNTRVERIEKRINPAGREQGWRLWLKSVERIGLNAYRATWWTEDFDAVAVATGRFNAPFMPSIPGLEDWMRRFPTGNLLYHSRQYWRPEAYTNQTVLIIGASVSGSEISRDLNLHARKVYVSVRQDSSTVQCGLERPRHRIPENTTLIGEIDQFLPVSNGSSIQYGRIKLKNGTIVSGIDRVIFATGYRYSFPFLPQYYYGATYEPYEGSAPTVEPFLPADGSDPRDLYLHQFYIQDPTLAFLNLAQGLQTFPVADYTSLTLAKVWTNTAKLPNAQIMRESTENSERLRRGYGARFAWLGCEEFTAFVRYVVGWLDEAAAKYGGKRIDGLPKDFDEIAHYWSVTRFGEPGEQNAFKDQRR